MAKVKKWLKDNDVEMHSIHNEGKSVIAERFIRTLKKKTFKHMAANSKNVCFDVLVFVVNKIKNTVPWTHVINDLNGKEISGSFYEKKLQKTNQEVFIIEKVLKRKGDKLYVKLKGYNNSFNSWIDKKDLV